MDFRGWGSDILKGPVARESLPLKKRIGGLEHRKLEAWRLGGLEARTWIGVSGGWEGLVGLEACEGSLARSTLGEVGGYHKIIPWWV